MRQLRLIKHLPLIRGFLQGSAKAFVLLQANDFFQQGDTFGLLGNDLFKPFRLVGKVVGCRAHSADYTNER